MPQAPTREQLALAFTFGVVLTMLALALASAPLSSLFANP